MRFGGGIPKQFAEHGGRPLIGWAIARLVESGLVDRIVVAVPGAHRSLAEAIIREGAWSAAIDLANGGATRQESVWNALESAPESELVAVHDAVRPNVSAATLGSLLDAAARWGGAIPGLPLTDTIHRVEGAFVVESPRRQEWVAAQTPQCFRREILVEAMKRARDEGWVGTDEAGIVARHGGKVRVLDGDPRNVKVTWREDLGRLPLGLGEDAE